MGLSKWRVGGGGSPEREGLEGEKGERWQGNRPLQKLHPPKKAPGEVTPSLSGSPASPFILLFHPLGLFLSFLSFLKAAAGLWSSQPRLTDPGGSSVPSCEDLLGAASEITAGDPPAALGRALWEGSLGTYFWLFNNKRSWERRECK